MACFLVATLFVIFLTLIKMWVTPNTIENAIRGIFNNITPLKIKIVVGKIDKDKAFNLSSLFLQISQKARYAMVNITLTVI